jgi:hypothetical protein
MSVAEYLKQFERKKFSTETVAVIKYVMILF